MKDKNKANAFDAFEVGEVEPEGQPSLKGKEESAPGQIDATRAAIEIAFNALNGNLTSILMMDPHKRVQLKAQITEVYNDFLQVHYKPQVSIYDGDPPESAEDISLENSLTPSEKAAAAVERTPESIQREKEFLDMLDV